MHKIDPKLERWWDWYSQALPFSRASSEWNWIERVANETRNNHPTISVEVNTEGQIVAGYCVLGAGALAIHGGIIQRLSSSKELSDIRLIPTHSDIKAICLETLITESFRRDAELYQALVPAEIELSAGLDLSENAYSRAGMTYLTRLVRMERQFPFNHPARLGSYRDPRLHIVPFESLPFQRWIELIERTYLNSDDVPELAAIRTTTKAVEGYRANRTPGVEGWFAIHCNGEPAGCLVLARHYHPTGEISYLGLAPEFRSQGYSFGIMQFAMEWMERQRCTKVALAVDCRNEVAMNVYQKWGFQATISYHAWVASPKTFQPSSSHH